MSSINKRHTNHKNANVIIELSQQAGNDTCGECGYQEVEYASLRFAVFLCTTCASHHRSLGTENSKVRHLTLDIWEDDHIQSLQENGRSIQESYTTNVPIYYTQPIPNSVSVYKEQWIQAKYVRQEFSTGRLSTPYADPTMEGELMKKAMDNDTWRERRFVLSERTGTLSYYIGKKRQPKTSIHVAALNATFVGYKTEVNSSDQLKRNVLQISYLKDNSTRHIFMSHKDGKEIVRWYLAIRSAKLNHLRVANPTADPLELVKTLTYDFAKEGELWKSGPCKADKFRRRWFTLENRKLMYHTSKLDPFPKGEIFIGDSAGGYKITTETPEDTPTPTQYGFTLTVPERDFIFSADNDVERSEWINAIKYVLQRPVSIQENYLCVNLVKKRQRRSILLPSSECGSEVDKETSQFYVAAN